MNTQLNSQLARTTQAGCLRTIAGSPAGYSIRHARQGSFLVLVIGTLALLAVITIVYVALGNQDSRTKSAVIKREQMDDVPAAIADYTSEVLSRDLFSFTLDGSLNSPKDPITGLEIPNSDPEATLRRETDDAPGVANDPTNPDTQYGAYMLTSDRSTIGTVQDARLVFTPWGGLHDWFISSFSDVNDPTLRQDFSFDGDYAAFRLFASDPHLASTSPTFLNFNASTQNRNSLNEANFTLDADAPYMQKLDWYSITNIAPDGLFVNLNNLRNNFDAEHNSTAPLTPGGPAGIGYGKSLLELVDTNGLEFDATTLTDWDFNPPAAANGTIPGRDDAPFFWTMRQRGAFRPARVSTDPGALANTTENPASPDFKLLQWADADGDGMLDSRWWEMAVGTTLPEDMVLPQFSGNMRWFFASRIVDLSGLLNVNFAGDLASSPAETYSFYRGTAFNELNRNFIMPLGMTPADIDLRRILMQVDSFANYKPNPASTDSAAYELIPGAAGGDYANYDERKAMLSGAMAYASLRLANQTGIVLGLDPLGDSSQSFINELREQQDFTSTLTNRPVSSFLNFADSELAVGLNNNLDAMGQRPWQTMMFPTRPWLQSPTSGVILATPSFGRTPEGQHHGWLDWSSRRTVKYLAQSRKLWNTTTDALAVRDSAKLRFGIDDQAELLERRTANNPAVTTPLEITMGARDRTINGLSTAGTFEDRVDILRSNRGLDDETQTYDPITDAQPGVVGLDDSPMRNALRRLNTDPRHLITTISGSRPLRNVASVSAMVRDGNTEYAVSENVSTNSISQGEVKINAREVLDLPPRPADGLTVDGLPPKIESAESAARIFFEGYVEGLAPYSSLDATWDRNNNDFDRLRTLFYGYRGAELAFLTAGTMAVNMVDLADGPTPAPLMAGPQAYNQSIGNGAGQLPSQLQPVRPGVSDPRNKPTIRTLILAEEGANPLLQRADIVERLDELTRDEDNNAASAPGQPDALGAMFPTWQAERDIEQPGTSLPTALDNLDISGVGKLAPENDQVITPAVNIIGIEPQVFVTQVTTMTVYFDNYGEPGANGYNAGFAGSVNDDTVKLSEPNVIADPGTGQAPLGANVIFDGSRTNNTEVLFKLVAFKLTNPFDRDVILGTPMFSDVPPNSVVGVNEPLLPDSPLQLVVDSSVTRYPSPGIYPNTDVNFPFRADLLPIFSRTGRWSVGNLTLSNLAGYPDVLSTANWNAGNPGAGQGVIGAFGRGDQIAVNTDAFLDGTVRADHISDFNYLRFGSRTYMLMSLNEQLNLGQEAPLPGGGPQSGIDPEVRQYRDYDRPDVLVPVAASGQEATFYKGTYATTTTNPGQISITLNPIRVPAGKTIVAYALSEAPHRILSRLEFAEASDSTFGIANVLVTPTSNGDGLVDGKPYIDQGAFIKRVIEKQIAAGAVRDSNGNQVYKEFASDIFNPNGAYWIPMIWDPKDQVTNPNFPNPPDGFTDSGLQDLRAYVNPIPTEAGVDLNRDDTIAPDEARAQRTVTLWRTVRQIPNNSAGSMLESEWTQVSGAVLQDLNTDWAQTPGIAAEVPSIRRPLAPGGLWIQGANDYRNDQMQDRLRIPTRLDMSVALRNTDVNQPGLWTNAPIEVAGTNTNSSNPNADADKRGYSVALWSSVRRPSDPRAAENMLVGNAAVTGYEFLYSVPEDILPAFCLEAKYWEDSGAPPLAGDNPLNLVKSWNLVSESKFWADYKQAVRQETFDGTYEVSSSNFEDGSLGPSDSNVWDGGTKNLRVMLGYLHGYRLGSTSRVDQVLNDVSMEGLTPAQTTVLSSSPQRIGSLGYTLATRTLRGTIDQKPNATVTGVLTPESAAGPFELLNRYLDTNRLLSGRLTYAEITAQVSMDADRERGNQSNNFYRDVDMRTAAGQATSAGAGNPEDFNEDSHYTRWVSTLRSADLLRPLGVGPLEAPAVLQSGNLVLRRNFVPRATALNEIQDNNARYTTLGEALACALGYENRDYATTANNLYAGQETRDINLLRSPYKLAGEPPAHAPFHLKPPPGALTGALIGNTLQAGDDSSLTLLFDRGNLWIDRFVPFIDDPGSASGALDCVMDTSGGTEYPVGPGLPAAQMALEQFETPATDPQALEAIGADNKAGLSVARQGLVNINTAPIEVLRALPGLAPRPYVVPPSFAGAGTARPSTNRGTTQILGDTNWFAAVPGTRPILPINQDTDIAAGIAAYRDMTPVLMSRSAMESIKISAALRGGTVSGTQPVGVPFLTPDANNIQADPFKNMRDALAEQPSFGSNTQIPGINRAPGLRSTAEILSARCRNFTDPPPAIIANQSLSRWPSGNNPTYPRHSRWKAAPWNIDQLGNDVNLNIATTPAASINESLNSSFGELDGYSSRSEYPLTGIDNPYKGVPVPATASQPEDTAPRNEATEAIRGVANEYDEQLIAANNVMNTITNRSDVFAVWFVAAGFQRSDVEGLEADDPLVPSVQRRFLMIVDRSNVVNKGEKPRILLMKEVPMDGNVQ